MTSPCCLISIGFLYSVFDYESSCMLSLAYESQVLVMLMVPLLDFKVVATMFGHGSVLALSSISVTAVVLKKMPDYAQVGGTLAWAVPINRYNYITDYRSFQVSQ